MIIETFKITLTCDGCSQTSEYATNTRPETMRAAKRARWRIAYDKDLCKSCKESAADALLKATETSNAKLL